MIEYISCIVIVNLDKLASDHSIDPYNRYYLHKNNINLKLARNIFRYLNNLDIKIFMDDYYIETEFPDSKSILLPEPKKDDIDKDAITKYWRENKIINDRSSKKSESSSNKNEQLNKLVYSNINLKESISDINDDVKLREEINLLARDINVYLNKIFDENYDEKNNKLDKNNLTFNIWKFLFFFNETKDRYFDTNIKLWKNFNIEIVYQIYRYTNRNEFETENLVIKLIFGFFYVLSFYLEIPSYFFEPVKKWISYLINKK